MRSSWVAVLGGCLLLTGVASATAFEDDDDKEDAQEQKIGLDKVPKAVTDAVKAKFPKGELKSAETGKDDGVTVYEVKLKLAGKSIDVSCKTDGTILEIEKEIAVSELPKAVTDAINAKYPNSKITEAEEVTELEDGDDEENEKEDADDRKQEGGKGAQAKDDDDDDDEEEGDELVYEVEITTADGKSLEVEVSPAGKILEAEADDDEKGEADEK